MSMATRGIVCIPFFIWSLTVSAQVNSVSPYSRLGIGDRLPGTFARNLAMGGASQALPQPLNLDISNPASYMALELVTLEAGLEFTELSLQQNDPPAIVNNSRSGFRYMAVGVPITSWWASSAGLKPYSFKGYEIINQRTLPEGVEVSDNFIGEGGLNRVYWGHAFRPLEGLSVGFNASYLFGSLREITRINFRDNSFLDTQTEDDIFLSGLWWEYGLQYQYRFANQHFASIGFSLAETTDLNADITSYQYTTVLADRPLDTLTGGVSTQGQVTLPSEFRLGVSYGRHHPQILNPAWALSLDYENYRGSEFRDADGAAPLADGYRLQIGGFFIPRFAINQLNRSSNYLANIEYRLGGYYEETPLILRGERIPEYGITFGLGLPIRARRAAPGEVSIVTVNLSASYGQRGTLAQGLILEEFWALNLGITFGDKWFIEYKYR